MILLSYSLQKVFVVYCIFLDKEDMSEEVIVNIMQEHSTVKANFSVRTFKPAFDQVFDFVVKIDLDSHETQEALKERSGVNFLETLLEAMHNGIMLELVMSEDPFGLPK